MGFSQHIHGNTSSVWLPDGNRLAMKVSHIPLVVMSVVTILVYVIPLTNVGC